MWEAEQVVFMEYNWEYSTINLFFLKEHLIFYKNFLPKEKKNKAKSP